MGAFHTAEFNWDKETRVFSADVSDLTKGDERPLFHQAYSDSIDEGLTLVSSVTGREATFVVDAVDAHEGDIHSWKLIPTRDSVHRWPGLDGCIILIFND